MVWAMPPIKRRCARVKQSGRDCRAWAMVVVERDGQREQLCGVHFREVQGQVTVVESLSNNLTIKVE
jgi:hypothetical protein